MPDQSIAIVGAGIAGLSAGCYAQMNGYRSQMFEMHNIPGGLCTAWQRKGYTFDGCIHHLAGMSPQSGLYRLWEELGAVQDRPMIYHDFLVQVEDPTGKAFTVYTDVDRLEEHLRTLAPNDGAAIDAIRARPATPDRAGAARSTDGRPRRNAQAAAPPPGHDQVDANRPGAIRRPVQRPLFAAGLSHHPVRLSPISPC